MGNEIFLTKPRSRKPKDADLVLPDEEKIAVLCRALDKKFSQEEIRRKYAPVKHVLTMAGAGVLIGAAFVAPGLLIGLAPLIHQKRQAEYRRFKKYNASHLERTLKRLKDQRLIAYQTGQGLPRVVITDSGKKRIIRYALNDLAVEKPKSWDGQWRLVVYDVEDRRKKLRDVFREALKNLGFYQMQKSIWIYPYPCDRQVSFLREYYGVAGDVVYIVARRLEDDSPYRDYFGLS